MLAILHEFQEQIADGSVGDAADGHRRKPLEHVEKLGGHAGLFSVKHAADQDAECCSGIIDNELTSSSPKQTAKHVPSPSE